MIRPSEIKFMDQLTRNLKFPGSLSHSLSHSLPLTIPTSNWLNEFIGIMHLCKWLFIYMVYYALKYNFILYLFWFPLQKYHLGRTVYLSQNLDFETLSHLLTLLLLMKIVFFFNRIYYSEYYCLKYNIIRIMMRDSYYNMNFVILQHVFVIFR